MEWKRLLAYISGTVGLLLGVGGCAEPTGQSGNAAAAGGLAWVG